MELTTMNQVLQKLQPRLADIFKHLHEHPEVSWQEHNTTHYIANLLRDTRWSRSFLKI